MNILGNPVVTPVETMREKKRVVGDFNCSRVADTGRQKMDLAFFMSYTSNIPWMNLISYKFH